MKKEIENAPQTISNILTNIWNGDSRSAFGEGTCCIMESSNEDIFFALSGGFLVKVKEAHPSLADA